MTERNIDLASLIGSRICHDLISPVGAINNGLELLSMTSPLDSPELDLISESVSNAGARIRFFRVAYGAAGNQMMSKSEVTSVLADISTGGRQSITWRPDEPQARTSVRLVFLALQCLETAMPYGGNILITQTDGQWSIVGSSDKLSVDTDLWRLLKKKPARIDVTPAIVQFALLPVFAKKEDRNISVEIAETKLSIHF